MLAFLTISLVCSFLCVYRGYTTTCIAIVDNINERLLLAAVTIDQLIPPDFIDRCIDKEPITDEEKNAVVNSVLLFQKNSGMTYLYIVVRDKDNGKIFFVIASGEAREGDIKHAVYVEYVHPFQNIVNVLENGGDTQFTEGKDDYGYMRSSYLRRKTIKGNYYVLGADLRIDYVQQARYHALMTFLGISAISFLVTAAAGWLLASQISQPIRKLSDFMVRLRKSKFSADTRLPVTMLNMSENNRNESTLLATNIDIMQSELVAYLERLKTITQQKERVESELRIAGEIQQSLLQTAFTSNFAADIAAEVVPARDAAGDLFDYIVLDENRIFLAIGDVSGKGMPAALVMSATLTLLRSGLRLKLPLNELISWVNDNSSAANPDNTFVTLWIGIYDSKQKTLTYCNGGHNPPILRCANGTVAYLPKATNPLVGVFEGIKFDLHELQLEKDDVLIAYTDGVTEAMATDGSLFGEARLRNLVTELSNEQTANSVLNKIIATVHNFAQGRDQSDDITVLVFKPTT
jgi:sigma-B regulation protein RsbU (phosphoserine phosphatase)